MTAPRWFPDSGVRADGARTRLGAELAARAPLAAGPGASGPASLEGARNLTDSECSSCAPDRDEPRQRAARSGRYQPHQFLPPIDVHARRLPENEVNVGEDFSWVVVRGQRYTFKSRRQAGVIRVLHETWRESGGRDGPGLSVRVIAVR